MAVVINSVRVVRGRFAFCGNEETRTGYTRVDTGAIKDFLTVEFTPVPGATFHYISKSIDGRGDLQHTLSPNQTTLSCPLDNVVQADTLYVFGAVFLPSSFCPTVMKSSRSQPIQVSEYYQRGDIDDCPICLEELGQDYHILQCGHTFCQSCIIQMIQTKHCDSCGYLNGRLPGYAPPQHGRMVICPYCQQSSV